MARDATPTRPDQERSLMIVGLLFVAITPIFVPAGAAALGIGAALERRGSRRQAAIVLLPAVFVLTVSVIQLLK